MCWELEGPTQAAIDEPRQSVKLGGEPMIYEATKTGNDQPVLTAAFAFHDKMQPKLQSRLPSWSQQCSKGLRSADTWAALFADRGGRHSFMARTLVVFCRVGASQQRCARYSWTSVWSASCGSQARTFTTTIG